MESRRAPLLIRILALGGTLRPCASVSTALLLMLLVAHAPVASAASGPLVLVQIEEGLAVRDALATELEQRGLVVVVAEPPRWVDPSTRGLEARVVAEALGAEVTVWVDAGSALAVVHAARIRDGLRVSSPMPASSIVASPDEVALAASALVEEALAAPEPRPASSPAPPEVPAASPDVSLDEDGERSSRNEHAYGSVALSLSLRGGRFVGPGAALRGAMGIEWPDGVRLGVTAVALALWDGYENEAERSLGLVPWGLGGLELGGRTDFGTTMLRYGIHALVGVGLRYPQGDTAATTVDVGVLAGGQVGLAWRTRPGRSIGVRLELDALVAPDGTIAPMAGLACIWDWD